VIVHPPAVAVAPPPAPPAGDDEHVRLRVRFKARTVEELIERYGEDIQADEIFIKTRHLRPVGRSLGVLLELSDGTAWFEGRCRVLWSRRADVELPEMRSGMALEIEEITPASQRLFDGALVEAAHRRLVGPPRPVSPGPRTMR
jgi:hypothetical protein